MKMFEEILSEEMPELKHLHKKYDSNKSKSPQAINDDSSLQVINDETFKGFWGEDCEAIFKQAISNLNLEDKIHIIKPAYYKDGGEAEGQIALTIAKDMKGSEFWDEVRNVCRQDKETVCRFASRLWSAINYYFLNESNIDCRIAWREANDREIVAFDRKVIAFLELACAKIELVIERKSDNSVILSTFCCCNYEGFGWKNDNYANVGVQDKVSEFTDWKQVEQYMKKELIEYCDKNNIDYTKDALDAFEWWKKLRNQKINN